MWHRIDGRMPEITCEASGEPPDAADCAAHPLHLELSNNLLWDPGINIWYNRDVDINPEHGPYRLHLNWVNNYMVARPDYPYGMILHDVLDVPENELYLSGNRMNLYPAYSDDQLAYCCNDFPTAHPNTDAGVAQRRTTRHPFPAITYTPTDQVVSYTINNVGAFPRDPMDQRYIASLQHGNIDLTPRDQPGADDAFALNFDPSSPPPAPVDTDADGMPDEWERAHGLDPSVQDHNGTALSVPLTGQAGYTNLECYLNGLADRMMTPLALSQHMNIPLVSK
jgi:hypothetical protein